MADPLNLALKAATPADLAHLWGMAAIWIIDVESDGQFRVTYLPLEREREPFCCGTEPACTPADLILDWVIGEAQPGDFVRVAARGVTLLVQEPANG